MSKITTICCDICEALMAEPQNDFTQSPRELKGFAGKISIFVSASFQDICPSCVKNIREALDKFSTEIPKASG
jgi:hypothetical protein